jgi:hypothetical protein
MNLLNNLLTKFEDVDMFNKMVRNFLEHWHEMGKLLITMPRSSCFGIGYRVGRIEKWMFNIYYNTLTKEEMHQHSE